MFNVPLGYAAAIAGIAGVCGAWLVYIGKARGIRHGSPLFFVSGTILLLFGLPISWFWPLKVNPAINPIFGEPSVFLGILLVCVAIYLQREGNAIETYITEHPERGSVLDESSPARVPLRVFGFGFAVLGLVLCSFGIAIARFNVVGGAPPMEPITGRLGHLPYIENTFFALLYFMAGAAFIAFFLALWMKKSPRRHKVLVVTGGTLLIVSVIFLAFSILNNYTHTGMLMNTCADPGPQIPAGSPECTRYMYGY